MALRQDYRTQSVPEIDHRNLVWIAVQNVANSFLMPEMTSAAEQGVMVSESHVTMSRFKYSLAILDGLIDEDKDDKFKLGVKTVAELMESRSPDPEWFKYWTRIDKLLRRGQLYSENKPPRARL